jgi:hypothetical protein
MGLHGLLQGYLYILLFFLIYTVVKAVQEACEYCSRVLDLVRIPIRSIL